MSGAVELSRSLLEVARRPGGDVERRAQELSAVDPVTISGDAARIAFWLNLYNALVLVELGRNPRHGSALRHRAMFRSTSWRVGGREYSLDVIEHGVLRRNARPPLRLRGPLRSGDPRLGALPSAIDVRIHFALNCGAVSCPPIQPYSSEGLDDELERVTGAYVRGETEIDRRRGGIALPYLLRLYKRDFGDRDAALEFCLRYLDPGDAAWLRDPGGGGLEVGYGRFDWTLVDSGRHAPTA